jgi:hypothetical protein
MKWTSIANLSEIGVYSGRYFDEESGYYDPVLIEIKDGDSVITFGNGQTIDNPDEAKTDFLDESQLSEGGEEEHMIDAFNRSIESRNKEIESLKQHNQQLTECLGELVAELELFYANGKYDGDMRNLISKATSLIK